MTSGAYQFRPMSAADLPMVQRWLTMPHVAQWWGAPAEQFALLRGNRDEPAADQYIVATAGKPIGYLQCYRLSDWNAGFGPQPDGARGIDIFIGEPDMVECGHGSALVRAFTDSLFASGASRAVTDPDPANARAIRAYQKAGFRADRLVETPDGVALLMLRDPDARGGQA